MAAVKPTKTCSQVLRTVLSAVRRAALLHPGDSVGVAVSGGADSVAMLRLLMDLREKLGIVPSVVHFNHQLRGKASDADEKFVAKLAAKFGLAFHAGREDVAAKARREKRNLEDAARRARYGFFARLVDDKKLTRIAVAQTADDQAETVLAHMMRGTGLAGLGGIHPSSEHVIRPLLHIRRSDLRVYLKERKQTWREDATNRDTSRTRVRIRRKLLPLLEKHFQPAVVEHLTTLAEAAREDEAFLEAFAAQCAASILHKTGGETSVRAEELLGEFPSQKLAPRGPALRKRIVRQIVAGLKQRDGQLNALHVQAVLEMAARGENGKSLPLPGGIEVRRQRDTLVFRATSAATGRKRTLQEPRKFAHPVDFSGIEALVEVPCLACVFRFRKIDWPAKRGETSVTGTMLDQQTLRHPLLLRNWRPGDRLHPLGHRKAHKLKRLLNEKRVSRWEREGWPVLTSAGVLVWARGFPVAAEFAANERTRTGILIAEEKIS
jgi:tRNA(Ile)-lysidine synthase